MRLKLTFCLVLFGFFFPTELNGKRKTREIEIRRVTRIGGFEIRQEKCMFIPDYGTCKKHLKVYGYNLMTNRCTEYLYSGCGGNPNRFATESLCRSACFVEPRKEITVNQDYYEDYTNY